MKPIQLIPDFDWSSFLLTHVNRCTTTSLEIVPHESKNRCPQFLQFTMSFIKDISQGPLHTLSLQTHHLYSTFKRRKNDRFYVVAMWNTRSVFIEPAVVHSCVRLNTQPVT